MAANPVVVPCPAGDWTKVATNVKAGTVDRLSVAPNLYKRTYRLTGQAAPTDDSDAALMFGESNQHVISHSVEIDVYVKAVRAAGSVRVDL